MRLETLKYAYDAVLDLMVCVVFLYERLGRFRLIVSATSVVLVALPVGSRHPVSFCGGT